MRKINNRPDKILLFAVYLDHKTPGMLLLKNLHELKFQHVKINSYHMWTGQQLDKIWFLKSH